MINKKLLLFVLIALLMISSVSAQFNQGVGKDVVNAKEEVIMSEWVGLNSEFAKEKFTGLGNNTFRLRNGQSSEELFDSLARFRYMNQIRYLESCVDECELTLEQKSEGVDQLVIGREGNFLGFKVNARKTFRINSESGAIIKETNNLWLWMHERGIIKLSGGKNS